MEFLTQIINGLSQGSIFALVALGYSMVYGITQLINFAHGDIIMVGAYATYVMLILAGTPLWAAILAAVLFCAIVGVVIEQVAYQRLLNKNAPRISLLITAIGVSMLLQNLFQLIFKSDAKSVSNVLPSFPIPIGPLEISSVTLITIATSVVIMVLLQILVKKTRIGKAMRATSVDRMYSPLRYAPSFAFWAVPVLPPSARCCMSALTRRSHRTWEACLA